jgi:hypothetical protein
MTDNIFTVIGDLSFAKTGDYRDRKDIYNQYIINRHFSYFIDSVLYANIINHYQDISDQLHHDFYLNLLRKSKRFTKWHKKEQDDKVEQISQQLKISVAKAQQLLPVLEQYV